MSRKVLFVFFAACQRARARERVCEPVTTAKCVWMRVPSVKSNNINHSHRDITPPRVIAVIDLSIIHKDNRWRGNPN